MAGIIEGQLIAALPGMMYIAACEGTLSAAKKYKNAVDSTYYFGLSAAECTGAAIASAASVYQRGLKGNLKELGKACSGFNDFQAAKEELGRSVEKKDGQELRRPMPVRVGEASAKVINGLFKMNATATAGIIGLTYATGVVCNGLGISGDSPDSMIEASKVVVTSINTVASITGGIAKACMTPASMVARAGVAVLSTGAGLVQEHPAGAAAIFGASVLLYAASSEAIRSSDESSYTITRVAHKAAAATAVLLSAGALAYAAIG